MDENCCVRWQLEMRGLDQTHPSGADVYSDGRWGAVGRFGGEVAADAMLVLPSGFLIFFLAKQDDGN